MVCAETSSSATAFGDLVGLGAVDAAEVGEKEQPVVRGGDEEVFDHVVAAQLGAAHALATALLRAVVVRAGALGEAVAGDGDDDVLFGDEVFHRHFPVEGEDAGAALVTELVDDFGQFGGDDGALTFGLGENVVEVVDASLEFGVLVHDLLALEGGQAAQLEGQDGVGLDGVHVEQLDEAVAGLVDRGGAADEGDDLVEGVEGLQVAFEDVEAFEGLAQAELRAAHDDVDLVVDPVADEAVDRQGAGHAVDEREHVGGEVLLQAGALVEVVEDDLGDGVALEDDDEALAGAAGGLVADVGDAADRSVAHELGDLVGQVVGVDLVGQLGDDEALATLDFLDVDDGALRDGAAAGAVRVFDALVSQDSGAGGEVRSGDQLDERFEEFFAGCSRAHSTPRASSRRLCGGMRVAMPTAMPSEPLASRFGKRAGRMVGSWLRPS